MAIAMDIPAIWTPTSAEERSYYDRLFQLADAANVGRLAGQAAVTFLARSGLPFPILKQVWDIAGDPKNNRNFLRRVDFYVAMRLIAMAQASPGMPISAERLRVESGVTLPLARMQNVPPPPAGCLSRGAGSGDGTVTPDGFPSVDSYAMSAQDPYSMSAQERSNYERLFPRYDSDGDGFVTGPEAVELFSKSGLPREHLRQIWEYSDADGDSKLSLAEFCVGMHLIVCVSKKGLAIPAAVPRSLRASAGTGSIPATSPAQALVISPASSVPPSPVVRPSPSMHPLSSPPSASSLVGPASSRVNAGDAFSDLAVDIPTKGSTSSSSDREVMVAAPPPQVERGPPASETLLQTTQPDNTHVHIVRSLTDVATDEKDSILGDPSKSSSSQSASSGLEELTAASNALLGVTRVASAAHSQAMGAQSSNVHSLGMLVQKLQAERISLGATVDAGKVEYMDNERQLSAISTEIDGLHDELDRLRDQFREQQQETIKLRARVTEGAVQRATLLAEIEAFKASLTVQEDEHALLRREEAMIDGTRNALESYSATLRDKGASRKTDSPPPRPTGDELVLSSAQQVAERLYISPAPREVEAKSDTRPEPVMPAQTPPPPPAAKVPQPQDLENPVAGVSTEDSENIGGASSAQVGVQSPTKAMPLSSTEEKDHSGFDAFPTVADAFETEFAMNGFGRNGAGEVALDDPFVNDPFSATDAVFTNATAAASDGFDAFPSSTGMHFDPFGQ